MDAKLSQARIESSDYNGFHRMTLPIDKTHPFSLTQVSCFSYDFSGKSIKIWFESPFCGWHCIADVPYFDFF